MFDLDHHRHGTIVSTALVAALATAGGVAAATSHSGAQRFVMTAKTVNGKDGPLHVSGRGVIDADGTFQIADEHRTSSGVFKFPHGTLRIVFTHGILTTHPNVKACRVTIDDRGGTFAIRSGTQAYVGAHGHGTYAETRLMIGARDTAGRCLLGPTSKTPPKLSTSVDQLVGTLSLS